MPECGALLTISYRSYPDPENPQERKELVVKLCASDFSGRKHIIFTIHDSVARFGQL